MQRNLPSFDLCQHYLDSQARSVNGNGKGNGNGHYHAPPSLPAITISRDTAAGAVTIGQMLVEELNRRNGAHKEMGRKKEHEDSHPPPHPAAHRYILPPDGRGGAPPTEKWGEESKTRPSGSNLGAVFDRNLAEEVFEEHNPPPRLKRF